jgi:hypothetical protein
MIHDKPSLRGMAHCELNFIFKAQLFQANAWHGLPGWLNQSAQTVVKEAHQEAARSRARSALTRADFDSLGRECGRSGVGPTLAEEVDTNPSGELRTAGVASLFGTVAMFLVAVGPYGVLAYFIGQRRLEIAIRMAVGGNKAAISRLILKQTLLLRHSLDAPRLHPCHLFPHHPCHVGRSGGLHSLRHRLERHSNPVNRPVESFPRAGCVSILSDGFHLTSK